MKEIIENSGLKLKEFAEKYKIPYNTLRQWYNGERKPPTWIKEILKNKNQNQAAHHPPAPRFDFFQLKPNKI